MRNSLHLLVKNILCFCFIITSYSISAQNSGLWVASGSGASTKWNTTAGGINIEATATNYGSGTSYILNDFQTNDTMGCNNSAYSDASIVGNPSLSIRHTFPNSAQITFNFSTAVENPVLHFDRLGGGEVSSLTSSSLVTILTPGITFTRLSGNDSHFVATSTTVGREAGKTYNSLPSECGPPLDGTASGSVRLNGVFSTVTFLISMDAVGSTSTVNDRWEIAFSDVRNLTLDFDGVDDYINRSAFLGNKPEVTMMSWIKLDNGFDGGEIMGQRNFRIFLDSNRRLKTFVKTNGITLNSITTPNFNSPVLSTEMWYHVAAIYDGNKGTIQLYLNGDMVWEYTLLLGNVLDNQASWNSSHDFEIGRNTENDNNYFEGSIYETRVYKIALTTDQLHRQINQEIENNAGNVRGKVIPKNIDGLLWSDLELYYSMDVLNTGQTLDKSINASNGYLHNMRTYQDKTAPLPYVTKAGGNGNWSDPNNWLYGSVWDISGAHPNCAIVKISDNLTTNVNHNTIGLIIDLGKKLTVNNDSGIFNSWYLNLNGNIDLEGESQLIQTQNSELAVTSSGKIERDQQGTADKFTYNYWSSPVGVSNTTSNNNGYNVKNVMRDGTQNINFLTSGYNGTNTSPIGIADYWIWKFANQLDNDYSAWQHIRSNGIIYAGEGYTMKGPGSGSIADQQNYVFTGKPNNGDINLTINAGNDYLVGNPYPSAIDAHQFILDNAPIIEGSGATTGTLYFWEHWGGGSHVLSEYQGGYATYNLSGGLPSASKGTNDPDVATGGTPTKTPGRYIPVSQGFFVVGEATGTIKFRNSQRVFQKENASSVFMRSNEATASNDTNDGDTRMKLRIGFNSVNQIHRQLLVTVDSNATQAIDFGYDGHLYDSLIDDMYWVIENEKFVIQGTNEINSQTILPLEIRTDITGINTISIDRLENVPADVNIYLHDKVLNIYHDLRLSNYSVNLNGGMHVDRFEITFSNQDTLGINENELAGFDANFTNSIESIVVINSNQQDIESIELYNLLGQPVYITNNIKQDNVSEYKVSGLSSGTYIIKVKTSERFLTKKVLVN